MKHLKQQGGFTLIEILATIAIMSIGFVAILQVFDSTNTLSRQSRNLVTATKFAQGQIDYYRALGYSALASSGEVDISESMPDSLVPGQGTGCDDYPACAVFSTPQTNIKQIDVYVYYKEGSVKKKIRLTTLVASGA